MKILFLCDGLGKGGKERRFVQLIKGLSKKGYGELYLILTRDDIQYPEIKEYDINISYINRKEKCFLFKFYTAINHIQPDTVQAWGYIPMLYYNMICFFLKHKPSYSISTAADCNYHLFPLWQRVGFKWSYYLSKKVIGNSMAGLESYKVPVAKRICIYNGFDDDRLQKGSGEVFRLQEGLNNYFIVTMLASFSHAKDWKMFIETAMSIINKRNDIVFLAVGDGPTKQQIENQTPICNRGKIKFLGRRDDVESILKATGISVLCTNSDFHGEGVSNSILESCAFGIPVIATRGGGTDEIIEDGKNGYIVNPHDSLCLEKRIIELQNNEKQRLKMGEEGRKIINDRFRLDVSTDQYIKLFDSLL